MAGRPYSNSEMKKIVDYLVEHKAYGQLRGRKMWVEFADSKRVNRTWQSLKEVFLKRILNNIQDPYFKLTTYQIASFKRGYDVQAKISDRLHYVNVDTDIDENTGENVDKETSNGHNNDNASTVADHRTSTETLVLDNACDCVEDLPRALEEYEDELIGKRKRRNNNRKYATRIIDISSDSSGNSTEDEDDSSSRGRSNRPSKRYIKPKLARRMTRDDDGLFLVRDKKKGGKSSKTNGVVKDLQRGSCNTDAHHRFDVPNVPEPKCSSPAEEIQPVKMIFKNGSYRNLKYIFLNEIGSVSDRSKILEDEIFKEIQIRDSEDTDDTDETEIGQQVKGHIEEQKQRERDIEEEQQGKGDIEEQQQGKGRIEEQQQGNGDIEEQQQGTGDIEQQQDKGDIEEQQQAKEDIEQQQQQSKGKQSTISQGVQTSLENLSINEESTQGYLDTDTSPIITQRKKKRAKTISRKVDTNYRLRKRCKSPAESSSDSNLSYFTARPPHRADSHSSLSSRIYKSESYQQLMPTKSSSPRRLDQIVECENDFYAIENSIECTEINCNTKEGSSNISLPTSPVLSVVENISISRSLIDDNNLNESSVKETDTVILNQLMSCGDDVSMPLMEQNLELDRRSENGSQSNYTINMAENSVSDSFLNKICSVQLEDLKFSESISAKLRDLLLESAKKLVTEIKTNKDKENTESKFQVSNFIPEKKRKRSSTPRRSERISNPISTDAVVEKEHRESCSKLNRESCPPVICVRDNFDKEIPPDITETPARKNGRGRKKKDIIKVKITRPRSADSLKKISDDLYPTHFENNTPKDDIFTNNDTESGIFLQGLNDSMDLVHNHSETCLQDHECIDSVEAVSNPAIPTVLIDSESFTSDVLQNDSKINGDLMGLEFLGSNAQDGTDYMEAFKCSVSTTTVQHEVAAGNHTPNSIITEDLTGDSTPKSCKWYLLSEDETKTDFQVLPNYVETSPSYGADLNQIFPLTCAIPNLSTITEMSKDNEDTSPNILTHFAIPN
ncbi:unnamed protein product [Leptidea sinapis]|uniref:Uncharacterized protein n=1 Tax=Leptidea sinapis TaxID=189913 RepID=A0A5E4Q3G7_9NEOP|nr:unnamed protein product [Leptidea sinapis]